MTDVGIAMVGCGQIAKAHMKAIAACGQARLTWCVDNVSDRAEQAAAEYGASGHTTDLASALGSPDVDAVVLCLPHDLHLPFTRQALEAGKHVLVEKPMALDAEEAEAMVDAATAADRNLMVGQSTRFTPSHQAAKQLLDEGRIGTPLNVARQTCFFVERLSTDWRRNVDACGGLYLPLFGSHDVDAMLWFLNDQPDSVSAAIRDGSHLSAGDVDGWIGLTFASGTVASIQFSLTTKTSRQATLLVGTEAAMLVERNRLSVDGEDVSFDDTKGAFERQIEEFVSSILEGRLPSVPGTDGVRTMRVLDLARQASDDRRRLPF